MPGVFRRVDALFLGAYFDLAEIERAGSETIEQLLHRLKGEY
jgi:hypothetical protein